MVECDFCGREQLKADSCTKNAIAEPDGRWFYATPHGDEDDHPVQGRCSDCGVMPGGTHHPGCDMERHPESGRQLLYLVLQAPEERAPLHARVVPDDHADISLDDVHAEQAQRENDPDLDEDHDQTDTDGDHE